MRFYYCGKFSTFCTLVYEILLLRQFFHFFAPLYMRLYYCGKFSTFCTLVYEVLILRQFLHFFAPLYMRFTTAAIFPLLHPSVWDFTTAANFPLFCTLVYEILLQRQIFHFLHESRVVSLASLARPITGIFHDVSPVSDSSRNDDMSPTLNSISLIPSYFPPAALVNTVASSEIFFWVSNACIAFMSVWMNEFPKKRGTHNNWTKGNTFSSTV